MIDFFNCLRNNRWFQAVVIGVILLSAVASGGRTYPLSDAALLLIDQIDYANSYESWTPKMTLFGALFEHILKRTLDFKSARSRTCE